MMLRGWSPEVTVFTDQIGDDVRRNLVAAKSIESAGVEARRRRRSARGRGAGRRTARRLPDALLMHPPQKQVALVGALGVALDDEGFVKTDPMTRETSMGIYAAGNLTTRGQAAVLAAAAGMQAAAAIDAELTAELAASGALP